MSLIKKCDVDAHFAARKLRRLHLIHQVAKPTVANKLAADSSKAATGETGFVADFSLEHSSPGGTLSAVVTPDGATGDAKVRVKPSIPPM